MSLSPLGGGPTYIVIDEPPDLDWDEIMLDMEKAILKGMNIPADFLSAPPETTDRIPEKS